jgi:hypothetical protein
MRASRDEYARWFRYQCSRVHAVSLVAAEGRAGHQAIAVLGVGERKLDCLAAGG